MEPLRELSTLIGRHAPGPRGAWRNDPLGLMFGTASYVPEPIHQVYQPVFALVVQGEKELVLGDEVFTCGRGTFIVVSVDLPMTFRISRATPEQPYMTLAMTLKPAAVAALLLEAATDDRFPVEAQAAGMGVSDAPAELLDTARPCRSKSSRASRR